MARDTWRLTRTVVSPVSSALIEEALADDRNKSPAVQPDVSAAQVLAGAICMQRSSVIAI